jgi:hypothetical protein
MRKLALEIGNGHKCRRQERLHAHICGKPKRMQEVPCLTIQGNLRAALAARQENERAQHIRVDRRVRAQGH